MEQDNGLSADHYNVFISSGKEHHSTEGRIQYGLSILIVVSIAFIIGIFILITGLFFIKSSASNCHDFDPSSCAKTSPILRQQNVKSCDVTNDEEVISVTYATKTCHNARLLSPQPSTLSPFSLHQPFLQLQNQYLHNTLQENNSQLKLQPLGIFEQGKNSFQSPDVSTVTGINDFNTNFIACVGNSYDKTNHNTNNTTNNNASNLNNHNNIVAFADMPVNSRDTFCSQCINSRNSLVTDKSKSNTETKDYFFKTLNTETKNMNNNFKSNYKEKKPRFYATTKIANLYSNHLQKPQQQNTFNKIKNMESFKITNIKQQNSTNNNNENPFSSTYHTYNTPNNTNHTNNTPNNTNHTNNTPNNTNHTNNTNKTTNTNNTNQNTGEDLCLYCLQSNLVNRTSGSVK